MDSREKKLWRDFGHTLVVITARARAEDRERIAAVSRLQSRPQAPRFEPRFEISLLAAAGDRPLILPKGEVLAEGGGLGITVVDRGTEIQVTLQLRGFASLSAHAGREARLVGSDGAIDYAFRFSPAGTGVCVLAASPEIRAGLSNLSVLVADD